MPTYEMSCSECGERFERFLTRILRVEDRVCPACGSRSVRNGVGGGFFSTPKKGVSKGCESKGGFV